MRKILRDLSHLVVAYSSNEVRQCALTQCNKKINVNIFTCGWKTGEEASCNNSNNDKLKRSQKAQVPVLNGNEEFTKILLAFIMNNSSETSKCILVNFTVHYWLTDIFLYFFNTKRLKSKWCLLVLLQASATGQNFFFDMSNTGKSQGPGQKRRRDHGIWKYI